jgi:hypothetical protein
MILIDTIIKHILSENYNNLKYLQWRRLKGKKLSSLKITQRILISKFKAFRI